MGKLFLLSNLYFVLVSCICISDRWVKEARVRWQGIVLAINTTAPSTSFTVRRLLSEYSDRRHVWFPNRAHPLKSSHRARIGTGGVPRGNELDTDITEGWQWPWQETWDVIIIWHLSTLWYRPGSQFKTLKCDACDWTLKFVTDWPDDLCYS